MINSDVYIAFRFVLIAAWIIIFIYAFFKRRGYLTVLQESLLVVSSSGYVFLEAYFLQYIIGEVDMVWILRDIISLSLIVLLFSLIMRREVQVEKIHSMQTYIEGMVGYKAIYNDMPIPIAATRVSDGLLVYANKAYIKEYGGKLNKTNTELWDIGISEVYNENNLKAQAAKGKPIEVEEPVPGRDKKEVFIKYYKEIEGEGYVFIMQKLCKEC